MRRYMGIPLMGLALACAPAFAVEYFHETFTGSVPTGPSQAPGIWYPDRYAPNQFDSQPFMGDDRLRIVIGAGDGIPPNSTPGRPAPYQSTFYNTHGRKYDLGNPVNSYLKAQLYVSSDWSTNFRRSDMWATAATGGGSATDYPIIGIANVTGSQIVCRVYDAESGPAGWVNVSANVPGGLTTGRWYSLEVRFVNGAYQYLVDGVVVYTDGTVSVGTAQLKDVMLQAYQFNDPALGLPVPFNDGYTVYWDNLSAGTLGTGGIPVDLNGSYTSPSSGPMNPLGPASQTGLAVASTGALVTGNVFERNGSVTPLPENAQNGVFTPFNDANKVPSALNVATANGTSLEYDLDLGGSWKPFQWGQGVGNPVPFATGDTFNVGWINGSNSFGAQVVTTLGGLYKVRLASTQSPSGALGVLDVSAVTLPAGTTKVRVNLNVVGGFLQGTVTPLDGPNAFSTSGLGSTDGMNLDTNSPWLLNYLSCNFVAGFEVHENMASSARAKVSGMTTDAVKNALYLFADDPYVRTADGVIAYRGGQANLLQSVTGYQAFMNAMAGQTFGSGAYVGPYTTFFPGAITAALDAAGAAAGANLLNTDVLNLNFVPGTDGVTGTGFRANVGTQTNLFAGGPPSFFDVNANTRGSNAVVIDNIAPVLGSIGLSGSAWVSPNVVPGSLEMTVSATDGGTFRSGLETRPSGVVTWSNLSTTPLTMTSLSGNQFRATIPVTGSTPNGTATVTVDSCDRAGNCTQQQTTFNVSTVNILLTLVQQGVVANVSRVIDLKFGGTGGASTPISLRRVVNFDTPVMVGPDPSRQGTTLITYQDLDLADDNIANNTVNSVAPLTRFYAKDAFFSLGKQENLAGTPGAFTGSAILRMGDVTNNNIVNVSDLAVWAANNGSSQNPNTTLIQTLTPRQANLDGAGTVDLGDRNLIISSWLFAGDNDLVGNFRGPKGSGTKDDGSRTVEEVIAETGLSPKLVNSMDLNKDGRITRDEVLGWRR